jgi:hypothetical protein
MRHRGASAPLALTVSSLVILAASPNAIALETPAPLQVCLTASPAGVSNPLPCPPAQAGAPGANGAQGSAGATATVAPTAAPKANPRARAKAKVRKKTHRQHKARTKRRRHVSH